jgi:hypothetical protein
MHTDGSTDRKGRFRASFDGMRRPLEDARLTTPRHLAVLPHASTKHSHRHAHAAALHQTFPRVWNARTWDLVANVKKLARFQSPEEKPCRQWPGQAFLENHTVRPVPTALMVNNQIVWQWAVSFFEKLTVAQPVFNGIRGFIAVFTKARH